jgi:Protein of unknown function (DUF4058)
MPLRDHFRPPLSTQRSWESFHAAWISSLADALNEILPPRYFAERQVHAGPRIEIDVATMEQSAVGPLPSRNGGTATRTAPAYSPPVPSMTTGAVFADDFEVKVIESGAGPTLVAAIELVSPGNKDRAEARRAFAAKCVTYLANGVSLIVVDVVTSRSGNVHNEIVSFLPRATDCRFGGDEELSAIAYRPVRRDDRPEIDIWTHALKLGLELPVLPLALDATECVPVELETTYKDALRRSRIT